MMDKKRFDSPDASAEKKLKNCKGEAEMRKVLANADMRELSIEELEGVSGGEHVVDVREFARLMGDDDW